MLPLGLSTSPPPLSGSSGRVPKKGLKYRKISKKLPIEIEWLLESSGTSGTFRLVQALPEALKFRNGTILQAPKILEAS